MGGTAAGRGLSPSLSPTTNQPRPTKPVPVPLSLSVLQTVGKMTLTLGEMLEVRQGSEGAAQEAAVGQEPAAAPAPEPAAADAQGQQEVVMDRLPTSLVRGPAAFCLSCTTAAPCNVLYRRLHGLRGDMPCCQMPCLSAPQSGCCPCWQARAVEFLRAHPALGPLNAP